MVQWVTKYTNKYKLKGEKKDEIKKSLTSISNFSTKCETSYLRKYNFDVYEPSIKKKIKKSSKDYFE